MPHSEGQHKLVLASVSAATANALGPVVGRPIAEFEPMVISNTAVITVAAPISRNKSPYGPQSASPGTPLIGMEWEPWFTQHNFFWSAGTMFAESVPSVGKYDSGNQLVIRQHMHWMENAGIDFLLVDWSNNLWGKTAWADRNPNVQEIVNMTQLAMGVYAQERKARRRQGDAEGAAEVPRFVLMVGLDNGPSTTW